MNIQRSNSNSIESESRESTSSVEIEENFMAAKVV